MQHVVMFSGGAGSYITAKRVAEESGTDNLILLFADTMMEDPDLHRFLHQAATAVGGHLEILAEYDKHDWGGCGCFSPNEGEQPVSISCKT